MIVYVFANAMTFSFIYEAKKKTLTYKNDDIAIKWCNLKSNNSAALALSWIAKPVYTHKYTHICHDLIWIATASWLDVIW